MITVVCFLWNDPHGIRNHLYVYDESYVLALKLAVEKNLSVPHEFICVTDKKEIRGIKTVRLNYTTHIAGTRFAKLMLYRPYGELVGKRVLSLDLDTVVTGSLDPLVDKKEDLVLWRNPNFGQPARARYNTSMVLHTCGTRPELWTDFKPCDWDKGMVKSTLENVQRVTGFGGTDQAWVSHRASPNEAHWTDADGVYGAGRLVKPDGALDGVGTELPDNARIVFTPGARTHRTPGFAELHPWVKDYIDG